MSEDIRTTTNRHDKSPSSVSWDKLPTRTTQPTSRIRTFTSTFAGLKKTRLLTTHSLLINAERGLILSWLGVQTDLLNLGIKYNMINGCPRCNSHVNL
ncbi:hypothetical protein TNCV_2260191 [Trichonephila clavipes]|nr:hypothetical protein TNCV_2260191 [Trichonephila clavipes]